MKCEWLKNESKVDPATSSDCYNCYSFSRYLELLFKPLFDVIFSKHV